LLGGALTLLLIEFRWCRCGIACRPVLAQRLHRQGAHPYVSRSAVPRSVYPDTPWMQVVGM